MKRKAWLIIIGIIAFTTLFAWQLTKTRFDYDFEKFFPIEDDETQFFYNHRAKFESDNDFLLIALVNKTGIFDAAFLKKVSNYVNDLEQLEMVTSINSITNQQQLFLLPNGIAVQKPYIDLKNLDLKRDSISIYNSEELINTVVSKDGQSLCLFLKHEEYISKKKTKKIN